MPSQPLYNDLRVHGINHVWCSPEQDNQYIFKPARLTRPSGAINAFKIMRQDYRLPVNGKHFHIFQIGSMSPSRLNVRINKGSWVNVGTHCRANNMDINVYTQNGFMYPRSLAWLRITDNGAIILAVQSDQRIKQSQTDSHDVIRNNELFVRFYTNAFFRSDRAAADAYTHRTSSTDLYAETNEQVTSLKTFINGFSIVPGKTYGFVNGRFRYPVRAADVVVGNYYEFIHDTTIDDVFEMTLSDDRVFTSDLDKIKKYMVKGTPANTIRFLDDCDFYLAKATGGYNEGLYIHRNVRSNIRMLTTKDYSVSIPLLESLRAASVPALSSGLEDLKLFVFRRRSGFNRPLVPDVNRLDVLARNLDYAIPQELRPLIEPAHPVAIWSAPGLEKSPYIALMDKRQSEITGRSVANAYGYHGSSKLIGDGLIEVTGPIIALPPALQPLSTVYGYGEDGLLKTVSHHTLGVEHTLPDPTVRFVEVVSGKGEETMMHVQRGSNFSLEPGYEYRLYRKEGVVWVDTTDTVHDFYELTSPTTGRWLQGNRQTVVISDKRFVDREQIFPPGTVDFEMAVGGYTNTGSFQELEIPTSDLDVWMNGHSLVESYDYVVHWPYVTIISKKYLNTNPSELNTMRIRARGFCDKDVRYKPQRSSGLIQHGLMSNDTHYDIYSNKVQRYIANGRSYHYNQLVYRDNDVINYPSRGVFLAEQADLTKATDVNSSNTLITLGKDPNHPANGTPYAIKRNYVSLAGYMEGSTLDLKVKDDMVDDIVSRYFALNLKHQSTSDVYFIKTPYELFSPFMASLILGCITLEDNLAPEEIPDVLVKGDVDGLLSNYLHLLDIDPASDKNYTRYTGGDISVFPHPFDRDIIVNAKQWRMLNFANKVYLGNRVSLVLGDRLTVTTTNPPENQW